MSISNYNCLRINKPQGLFFEIDMPLSTHGQSHGGLSQVNKKKLKIHTQKKYNNLKSLSFIHVLLILCVTRSMKGTKTRKIKLIPFTLV